MSASASAVGLLLALFGLPVFLRLVPTEMLSVSELRLDSTVVLWTLALGILTGSVFGLTSRRNGPAPLKCYESSGRYAMASSTPTVKA